MRSSSGWLLEYIKRRIHIAVLDVRFHFISLNLSIGWQLSIWNCCKPFFPLLYDCQLLCFWRLALSTAVEVFARPFFPDIAPSRMFTTNSCLIVCPIHKWGLFLKIFKSYLLLLPFEKLHHSLFYLSILFLTFFSSTVFQMTLCSLGYYLTH